MAQQKIIWTPRAEIDLFKILGFHKKRNGSNTYSKNIYLRIIRSLLILKKFPGIGSKTDIENVKNLIIGDFCLFYKIGDYSIDILAVWDSRQNPENLNLK